jgi:NADH-quinone oxidoreductase subunit J
LLTRRDQEKDRSFNWSGLAIALLVFGFLVWAILGSAGLKIIAPPDKALTVQQIGQALMTDYVWPLQCVGLLLTAALIGALVLVMEEKK